jgi:hypothetical protein
MRSSSKGAVGERLDVIVGERPVRKTGGYCWSTSFTVLGVLFLGAVYPTFLPSKKAYWAHQFRYLGVGQQYLISQDSPPRMKIAGLFSGEYPGVIFAYLLSAAAAGSGSAADAGRRRLPPVVRRGPRQYHHPPRWTSASSRQPPGRHSAPARSYRGSKHSGPKTSVKRCYGHFRHCLQWFTAC